ncbi:hypothetical protein [Massilia terrae]|uniref:Uncharacterized protein n=1 Tax=Massilia terrae TaxID=1811224 RepID=A0ABT2D4R2_9BURK|nr:hypothetical protein [Massilia terrae]MCS0660380.1 hypothetical protein [Massilia terrae]
MSVRGLLAAVLPACSMAASAAALPEPPPRADHHQHLFSPRQRGALAAVIAL